MKNITAHSGILDVIQRLPSSTNGNPRYLVRIDGFTCATAPDAAIGYAITNFDGCRVDATIGTYYGRATIGTVKKSC